ncbi:C45 family autoproteolytic acyltransferase/hydolase [Streptomyces sp. 6N223]|uniref:C45 family autoproteolytic acyltransferase/hydolase n=1 Tax=Streptomyces sp. 6N223 TaxID=3457412 RepID=UPI003FD54E9D
MSEPTTHRLSFRAFEVGDGTDGRWAAEYQPQWAEGQKWATDELRTPDGAARARRTFETHMPELVPVLDRLAAQLGRPGADIMLTGLGMKPFWSGCTVGGAPGALLRNYDFPVDECDRTIVSSHFLRPVIGMGDMLWGMLDGMNDAGLAVALTFGGRFVDGYGFSILVVVRYLLETCDTVDEALAALDRLPIHLPQNLVLADRERAMTVYLAPDLEKPIRAGEPALACAANHQHLPVPEQQERESRTQQRLAVISEAGARGTKAALDALLSPPVYADGFDEGYGTLYTAAYHPGEGRVTYHWPGGAVWEQSFGAFDAGTRTVSVGYPG